MMPFDTVFADLAKNEVRVIHALDHDQRPRGAYLFREFYCNEPNCDCRRVLLQVYWAEGKRVAATINYAFEPPKPPFDDEPQIFLDPINPQSGSSEVLFDMFEEMITSDARTTIASSATTRCGNASSMTRRIPTTRRFAAKNTTVRRSAPRSRGRSPFGAKD